MSLLTVGAHYSIDTAEAAPNTFGTQVFEAHDFASNVDGVYSGKVGIYGEVLFASGGLVNIHDRVNVGRSVEANIRLIPTADKQRLSVECLRTSCTQIITGFMVRGTLHATDVHWLGSRARTSLVRQCRDIARPNRVAAPLQLTASPSVPSHLHLQDGANNDQE